MPPRPLTDDADKVSYTRATGQALWLHQRIINLITAAALAACSGCGSGVHPRCRRALRSVSFLALQGGCLCGAIRYQVEGSPSSISICHCRSCRRASGAPVVSWVVVSRSQFKLMSGVLTIYQSSKPVHRGFCGTCGTQITYRHESAPEIIELTTASLDEPEHLQPTKEIWLAEKLPWAAVNANLAHHSDDP
jgi:hypothetical protein